MKFSEIGEGFFLIEAVEKLIGGTLSSFGVGVGGSDIDRVELSPKINAFVNKY